MARPTHLSLGICLHFYYKYKYCDSSVTASNTETVAGEIKFLRGGYIRMCTQTRFPDDLTRAVLCAMLSHLVRRKALRRDFHTQK